VVATRLEGATRRPYRSAVEATVRAIGPAPPNVRFVVAHPERSPEVLVDLLDEVLPAWWDRVPVPGEWSLATALDRALLLHPADVLVSLAPGMAPRDDLTPDWVGALVGLARSPGAGLVGALVADRDDVVHHAGWDVPNYRWYELEGLRVGQTTSGNDLLIERECSHVPLATGRWHEAGRHLSQALVERGCRTLWTPYARVDERVAIEL
jgi:hypothetical protein